VFTVFAVGTKVYALSTGGLSISTNSGATFTIRTPIGNTPKKIYAVDSTVYVAGRSGLSISSDGGVTFTYTGYFLGNYTIAGIYVNGLLILIPTLNSVLIFSNDGANRFGTYDMGDLGDWGSDRIDMRGIYGIGSYVYLATFSGLFIDPRGGGSYYNATILSERVNGVFVVQ
jgi:hypothetical protein